MHLYKYRGGDDGVFRRDLKSLVENYYWAAELHTLNDPCEAMINTSGYFEALGVFETAVRSTVSKDISFNKIRSKMNDLLAKVLTVGVFSLSKNCDDELMWSHYAAAHHGFCVGYNMEYLNRSLMQYFYNLLEVAYLPEPPELKVMEQFLSRDREMGMKQLIATKSLRWKNEEEVRIVTDQTGLHRYDYRSVDRIYFGLRMSDEQKEMMMEALKGRGIQYYQMEMAKAAYKFIPKLTADTHPNAQRYLYKVSPVMDGATDERYLHPQFKKYAGYLAMAAEIARREPYCNEVIMVGFNDRSPADQPIVFAHCDRSDKIFRNFEYSLLEIDKLYSEIQDL